MWDLRNSVRTSGLGCAAFLLCLFAPGLTAVYFGHSRWWLLASPVVMVAILFAVAAFGGKRKITPQEWANDLEKHLLGTERAFDWDDATSVTFADERLERLRNRLVPEFDTLSTPERREEFRHIIEALRRGEVPDI
jgi:hypothetical protein